MKYILTSEKNRRGEESVCSYLLDDNEKAVEIRRNRKEQTFMLGDIFIAMVKKVLPNLDSAFVEINPGCSCYLPLHTVKNPIFTSKGPSASVAAGDQIVVQLVKEKTDSKVPAVTTEFTLQGRYCVYMWTGECGVSKKIQDQARKDELLRLARSKSVSHSAFLMRTKASQSDNTEIEKEMDHMLMLAEKISRDSAHMVCYSSLYKAYPDYLKQIRSFSPADDFAVLTEDPALGGEVRDFLAREYPEMLPSLKLYSDDLLPLRKRYRLDVQTEEALRDKVWLDSGAYLIISPTEALTAIDVNTGKSIPPRKKDREDLLLSLNREAAKECMRQIRLRNLSGIIIIDFINMREKESEENLMAELKRLALQDPVKVNVIDITRLGLVELTRKREGGRLVREDVIERD